MQIQKAMCNQFSAKHEHIHSSFIGQIASLRYPQLPSIAPNIRQNKIDAIPVLNSVLSGDAQGQRGHGIAIQTPLVSGHRLLNHPHFTCQLQVWGSPGCSHFGPTGCRSGGGNKFDNLIEQVIEHRNLQLWFYHKDTNQGQINEQTFRVKSGKVLNTHLLCPFPMESEHILCSTTWKLY